MNALFRMPIRFQLIMIVAIVALPAAGIIIYSGVQQKNRAIREAKMDTQRLVDRIASEQRILTSSARQLIVSLSQMREVKEIDAAKMDLFLSEILKLHPNFSNLFIADSKGTIWSSAVPFSHEIQIDDRRFFRNALASRQLSSGEFQVGRVIGRPTLNFGYPYKNSRGEIVGVICAGIALEEYGILLEKTQLSDNADMVLLDHNGVTLFSSNSPRANVGKPFDPFLFTKMQQGADSATLTDLGSDGGLRRQYRFVSYQKLRLEGEQTPYMYVRVGIPVESVLLQAKREIVRSLSLFAFTLASALFIAWFVGRRSIADRIALLECASQSLAGGDFQVRVSEQIQGGELGRLGELFDSMARQLASREESLANSQRFLNTVIDTEPDCVKMLDADGRVLMMNRAGLEIMEVDSLEEIKGQSIFPRISAEYRESFIKLTRDVFQGISGRLEYKVVSLNGRHVWLGTHAVPFRNDLGEIVSLLGITRDITARREAEQALRRSEADLKKAQAIAKIGSWTCVKPDSVTWSEEMYRTFGVSPESFTPTKESFANLVHPDDRPAVQAWISSGAGDENPGDLEFRVVWPDGTMHYVNGRSELVRDGEGGHTFLTGTAQDITERKLAEQALAKSEAAFRATFEQAAVGMARVAPDSHWLQVNQRLCDLVGYTEDELLTMRYQDVTHPDDLEGDLRYGRALLAGDINTCSIEKRYIRKDRSVIWVNLTLGLVRDPAGAPAYFISVVEDITKRKLAENALAEKQRLLAELNLSLAKRVTDAVAELRQKDQVLISQGRQAALGEMIGNIAHQWRQPLNTLGLIVQELKMTYGRDQSYEESLVANVGKAMDLIQHMSRTIDDFSNYFKPDKEKVLFNVYNAINRTLALIEPSLAALDINVEVVGNTATFIDGYANEYSQVLLNILLNCRDAFEGSSAEQRRVIEITVSEENQKSVVTVSDNAGGIPEGILDKIFDPYFTTKGPDKGTGIGLYMAKTIIEKNMSGTLSVQNTAGGVAFRIEI